MTNEEAIHIIDVAFGVPQAVRRFREDRTYHEAEIREAKDMAIKALSCSENPNRCEDAISRQAVIDSLHSKFADGFDSDRWWNSMSVLYAINKVPSISTEKTDAYKQGWHDAITTALKETHSVHTEEGHFRVVQEETLIGVGMAYEQVSTEKTGQWIRWYEVIESADGKSTDHIPHCKCSECNCEYDTYSAQFIKYCPECGAKMGVEE